VAEHAIRPLYDALGADGYYQQRGDTYTNPHADAIKALITDNIQQINCDGGVLDFCAGGGEVSQVLHELGVRNITGSDPYTYALYERQNPYPCQRISFDDVIKNGVSGEYSTIICSFALHLCPEKDLFPVVWNLLEAAPQLIVITPHKRPELEKLPAFALEWVAETNTEKGKKVRMKAYKRKFAS
jgi:2-polyprenyl-3-methyl-5-hydroxy-6-metoxy-1,4-benzoquinol methylase